MGICYGVIQSLKELFSTQLPSISSQITLENKQALGRKVCVVSFLTVSKNITETSLSQTKRTISQALSPSSNSITIEIVKLQDSDEEHEYEFKEALDKAFDQVCKYLRSSRMIGCNRILIKSPCNWISEKYHPELFTILIQKIASLNGELQEKNVNLFFEIPWKQIRVKQKRKIIKGVLKDMPTSSRKVRSEPRIMNEIDPTREKFNRSEIVEQAYL